VCVRDVLVMWYVFECICVYVCACVCYVVFVYVHVCVKCVISCGCDVFVM